MNLDYDQMPNTCAENAAEADYQQIAKLMLATGAVAHTNGMAFGNPDYDEVCEAIAYHFKLKPLTYHRRWEHSKADWENLIRAEIDAGRPVLVAGRTTSSPAPWENGNVEGHWYNIDGYNDKGEFFVDFNIGNHEGWRDVDDFDDYKAYNVIVIGFEAAE